MSVWFLSSSLDLNCLEIRVQACHCLLCGNKDGRASLKPGVSHLSANLLKSYLTIIFFQKEYLRICCKIFFFNMHRKNKMIPSRSQYTVTCHQEWNTVHTFCMMLLLQKKFSQRVNIVELLSIFQEIFNLVNFNSKLH